MEQILFNPLLQIPKTTFLSASTNRFQASAILTASQASSSKPKLPAENHCYPRRTELPLGPSITRFPLQNRKLGDAHVSNPTETEEKSNLYNVGNATADESEWSPDELEAIAALFQRRMPEKAGKRTRERLLLFHQK
ncbi:pentatricopeptide repeat-containing protein At2g01860-like [Dendrobium catenatum]|uniref:pentatricopeptide repeat-containing protein At2g01860-like n=1 Tax=Dendrobium catenatum TaxID=906689 RepID=UPI00109F5098|nr:pentatricopeptide repeat-containing protein At2g01860-like [Dendrobium catenatum]